MQTTTKGNIISNKRQALKNHINEYIISHIEADGYDIPLDSLITTEGKLRFLYNTFLAEYGWAIERYGEQKAFREWLQGLPSSLNIEFTNYNILQLARQWGSLSLDATERQERKILNNYWNFITVKTFQLFKKFKITKI